MELTVNIYSTSAEYLIFPCVTTTKGFRIDGLPVSRLVIDCPDTLLADAIVVALGHARQVVLHPPDLKEVSNPLVSLLGFKNEGALNAATIAVYVSRSTDRLCLYRWALDKRRRLVNDTLVWQSMPDDLESLLPVLRNTLAHHSP